MIIVSINYCQLFTIYMLVLAKTLHLKCVHVFLTSQRLLIRFGMKSLFIRWKLWILHSSSLRFFQSFLRNRYQRVISNGQTSDWLPILPGVPQGSILGPLLILIYINDLPDGLESLVKLFADNIFLFSKVYDSNVSARQLSNDLQKITV